MSLLHRALKKAEKDSSQEGRSGMMVDSEEPSGGASGLRIYILIAVALAVGLFFAYTRMFRPGQTGPSAVSMVASPATPLGIGAGPPAPEVIEKARGLLERGRWAEAKAELEKAVILEPRNAEAYNNLGFALKKMGRLEEALDQYRKALAIEPNFPECLNNAGVVYLEERQLSEARNHFQKAIGLREDYADPHFHLALLSEAEEDAAAAKKHFARFIELSKDLDGAFLLKLQKRMASL